MTPCLGEHLELYAAGRLTGDEADAVLAHLRVCEPCTREVAWLRAEQRIAHDRARSSEPSAVRMARLKRGLQPRLVESERAAKRNALLSGVVRVASSFGVAVVLAFVASNARLPAPTPGEWGGSSCVSVDVPGVCPGPTDDMGDLIAKVESSYDACLVATPRSQPGAWELCL